MNFVVENQNAGTAEPGVVEVASASRRLFYASRGKPGKANTLAAHTVSVKQASLRFPARRRKEQAGGLCHPVLPQFMINQWNCGQDLC